MSICRPICRPICGPICRSVSGCGLSPIEPPEPTDEGTALVDENGAMLVDENGNALTDEAA